MKVCMVGHGMMGTWHSDSLKDDDCVLHTLVGREPEDTAEFAQKYAYQQWTVNYAEALASDIDVVIIAGPSASHAAMAIEALDAGKHVLVEIPLALNYKDAEAVVAKAEQKGLALGVVHPMRFRREHIDLCRRVAEGSERIRHVHSRLFLHRLENIGSTGHRRTWTDNLLWHHGAHLVDVGLWLCGAGDPETAARRISRSFSIMPPPLPQTGIPMELAAIVETDVHQSIVCTGSYHSQERIFDVFAVTDKNSYRLDILQGSMSVGGKDHSVLSEQDNNAQVSRDFINAVREGRVPLVTGRSVLPAMRLLQDIEDQQSGWWANRAQGN
ncbi:Gfo/Idh/MocA family oxidoreductase [Agrobacterium leguminum]|uniref:Gfo/Idh/MocA family oxidoreductase n=1 Tax=Agrobacterium leguminum TaxID=2792015 RepID=A0A9X3KII9_9HYPH|nr:Gfo/Idh/MocA family oxidoreductase [Agrobacterium leguminum]MCZ7911507.1 Gfo/Idh/MocA family oxidoreductase [Agrobacterium leguminum]